MNSPFPFNFIHLPNRSQKPRESGLTMMLDKGLTLSEVRDLSEMASGFIDWAKLGWGTSRILSRKFIQAKIELYQSYDISVSPGGTFLEIAIAQKLEDAFLKEAREMGFNCLEVSDGVVPLKERKLDLIKRAKDMGYLVVSEVGRKAAIEDARLSVEDRIEEAQRELQAGSWKVIMEGRESGTVGVFNPDGAIRSDLVQELTRNVGLSSLMFEAPKRNQQVWFIANYGNEVNLGNIAPQDIVSLESLRMGLRADTMLQHHVVSTTLNIALGPSDALRAARLSNIVVVIDALRMSSTIVTALAGGMRSVVPVSSVDECIGEITAGERGGKKIEGLMYDNSPLSFSSGQHSGKQLVLTSTNGTECLRAAGSISDSIVLVGSLLNAQAVAACAYRYAQERKQNITLLVAGRNNRVAVEDVISANEIAAYLPMCSVLGDVELLYSSDFARDFLESESGMNLVALGKRQDVLFCAQKDIFNVVPIWENGKLVLCKE